MAKDEVAASLQSLCSRKWGGTKVLKKTKVYSTLATSPVEADIEGEITFAKVQAVCPGLTTTNFTGIEIGDAVTSIGKSAFWCCTGLTSVTIPGSVTRIGGNAFTGCEGLTSIMIPNGVTFIGNQAFWYCTGLTCVMIPSSLTQIYSSAFMLCNSLVNITSTHTKSSLATVLRKYDSMRWINGDTNDPKTVNCTVSDGNTYTCTYQYDKTAITSTYSGTLFQE